MITFTLEAGLPAPEVPDVRRPTVPGPAAPSGARRAGRGAAVRRDQLRRGARDGAGQRHLLPARRQARDRPPRRRRPRTTTASTRRASRTCGGSSPRACSCASPSPASTSTSSAWATTSRPGSCARRRAQEYEDGLIKRHEFTRQDKEDDRTRHIARAERQRRAGLPHLPQARRDRRDRGRHPRAGQPLYDFVTADGIGHTVWVVPAGEAAALAQAVRGGPGALRRRRPPPHRGGRARRPRAQGGQPAPPRRRAVQLLPGRDLPARPAADHGLQPRGEGPRRPRRRTRSSPGSREKFAVAPSRRAAARTPRAASACSSAAAGIGSRRRPGTFPADDPVRSLDVAILQENLLAPVLGIADPRTDKRIDFVGGIRGLGELEKRVPRRAGRSPSPSTRPRSTSSWRWPTPGR